jgi:hypothetical protein
VRTRAAARAAAAVSAVALGVVLSLNWFTPAKAPPSIDGGGILNLLDTYGPGGLDVSGWSGLSPFSVAFLVVAALVTIAGRGVVAVAVGAIALAILLADLLTLDDAVALRWPAYAGVALAIDLLACATWAWRASDLESPVA